MVSGLVNAIVEMREDQALALTRELLDGGTDPLQILDDCRAALELVGKRFEAGDYFLPELVMAGEMLKGVSALVKPHLAHVTTQNKQGKILIGTVKGDIHDLGKDIVVFLLDVNGFDVRDIGVDVPAQKFVEHIREWQPDVVGLSGLLTVAAESMKKTVDAICTSGLRNNVKVMVGGGAMDNRVCSYVGADAYGPDAMAAVTLARQWVGGN